MSHSQTRPTRVLALVAIVVGMVLPLACGVNPQPKEYGDDYRANFMLGCTGREPNGDVPDGGEVLASKKVCACIYDGLEETVPFDEAKDFEDKQSKAESGADIEVPKNIQSIIDGCAGGSS